MSHFYGSDEFGVRFPVLFIHNSLGSLFGKVSMINKVLGNSHALCPNSDLVRITLNCPLGRQGVAI